MRNVLIHHRSKSVLRIQAYFNTYGLCIDDFEFNWCSAVARDAPENITI